MIGPAKTVCKKCGRSAPSDQFVLDPIYKTVVCPLCIKDHKKARGQDQVNQGVEEIKQQRTNQKPVGWDQTDEYLEKVMSQKSSGPQIQYERISEDRIKCVCPKCNYKFIRDIYKKFPNSCPYCNTLIFKK
jgi:Zn finger protein HypA/HybF involved in hydrogenase expression